MPPDGLSPAFIMSTPRKISLASRLTAGCVTFVIILAAAAAGVGWWWKFRAAAHERAQQAAPAGAEQAAPQRSAEISTPSGDAAAPRPPAQTPETHPR
jgi:hypothetical protein